jgi:hypothetical protein
VHRQHWPPVRAKMLPKARLLCAGRGFERDSLLETRQIMFTLGNAFRGYLKLSCWTTKPASHQPHRRRKPKASACRIY